MKGDWQVFDKPTSQISRAERVGNLTLLKILLTSGGVDKHTLTNLVALKAALSGEFLTSNDGVDKPTPEYVADIHAQFTALAERHDKAAKARETEEAREVFCRQRGMKYEPRVAP